MCQTSAPRSRQHSVIAAAVRPVETLVITRHIVDGGGGSAAGHDHLHVVQAPLGALAWFAEPELRSPLIQSGPVVETSAPVVRRLIFEWHMMTAENPTVRPLESAARELMEEMSRWPIFDPHSHIDPRRPAARNFDEVLGYHYYTELAHAAGMPTDRVDPALDPRTRAQNLAEHLSAVDNTVQYSWLVEIARTFHQFPHDRITPSNIGGLFDKGAP